MEFFLCELEKEETKERLNMCEHTESLERTYIRKQFVSEYRMVIISGDWPASVGSVDPTNAGQSPLNQKKVQFKKMDEYAYIGLSLFEEIADKQLAQNHWQKIQSESNIHQMIMENMHVRFGRDTCNSNSWINYIDQFCWIDQLSIDFYKGYLELVNAEAAELSTMLFYFQKRMWFLHMSYGNEYIHGIVRYD